jgi:hypothetical protein
MSFSSIGLTPAGSIVDRGTIDSVGTNRLDLAWYIEAGKRLGDGELVYARRDAAAPNRLGGW